MVFVRCMVPVFCAALLASSPAFSQTIGDGPARAAAIAEGRATFRQFCSPCHGLDARGDGPVGRLLLTRPSDLTQVNRRNSGQFPADRIEHMLTVSVRTETEAHGSAQMPIWGPVFTSIDPSPAQVRARIANLIAYLESIQE